MDSEFEPVSAKPPFNPALLLKRAGLVIFSAGLVCAAIVYFSGHDDSSVTDDDALNQGYYKRESAEMQREWGNLDSITLRIQKNLRHPGTKAAVIATGSIIFALTCAYLARRFEETPGEK